MAIKRRLSTGASSSSSTPAPSVPDPSFTLTLDPDPAPSSVTPLPPSSPSSALTPSASPADLGLAVPSASGERGSSLASGSGSVAGRAVSASGSRGNSATPTPAPLAKGERSGATGTGKAVMVAGSGDGTAYGDECFLWTDLPMNKGGFRYHFCTPSPNISPSPLYPFCRNSRAPWPCPPVHLSWLDRSAFLRLSPNALSASTDKGFRSARANVGVREGDWYYEVIIERGDGASGGGKGTGPSGDGANPHVRIGWGRREASLDAPVGLDAYSYAIRDVAGEKVHLSRPKPYGRPFKTGDVIGCLISLPPRAEVRQSQVREEEDPAEIKRMRIPLKWRGVDYFEMAEFTPAKEMEVLVDREGKGVQVVPAVVTTSEPSAPKKSKNSKKPKQPNTSTKPPALPKPVVRELNKLPGSRIAFYLNGEPLGDAFTDIYDFTPLYPMLSHTIKRGAGELEATHDDGSLGYYPMVSCFGRGKVRCNFGPDFEYPPRSAEDGEGGMEGDEDGVEGGAGLPPGTRPMCERWDEFLKEEAIQDEIDETHLTAKFEREMKETAERAAANALKSSLVPSSSKKSAASKNKKKKAGGGGGVVRAGKEGTPSTPRFAESTPARSTAPPDDVRMETDSAVDGMEGSDASPLRRAKGSVSASAASASAPPSDDGHGQGDGDGEGEEVDSVIDFTVTGETVNGIGHEDGEGEEVEMKSEGGDW